MVGISKFEFVNFRLKAARRLAQFSSVYKTCFIKTRKSVVLSVYKRTENGFLYILPGNIYISYSILEVKYFAVTELIHLH